MLAVAAVSVVMYYLFADRLIGAFIREAERKETRPAAEWTEAVEEKIRPDAAGRYESRETGTAGQNTAQEAETAGQGAARETGTPAPGGMAQGAQAAAPLRGADPRPRPGSAP